MAVSSTLIGAIVMGGALAVIFGAIMQARDWRREGVTAHNAVSGWRRLEPGQTLPRPDVFDRVRGRPLDVTLLLLGIGTVLGAVAFAAAVVLAADLASLAHTLALGGVGFLLGVYLLAGVYISIRSRGHGSAAATAAMGITLGLLLLIAVSVRLLAGA